MHLLRSPLVGSTTEICNPNAAVTPSLKGEIHSKIESILKERVHFSLQNSEKIMKIGWEVRKIWHFEISHFFGKHFLTSPYEYSNEWVDDVIPSQFFIYMYIVCEILKIFHF